MLLRFAQDDTYCVGYCPAAVYLENMVILSASEESSHHSLGL